MIKSFKFIFLFLLGLMFNIGFVFANSPECYAKLDNPSTNIAHGDTFIYNVGTLGSPGGVGTVDGVEFTPYISEIYYTIEYPNYSLEVVNINGKAAAAYNDWNIEVTHEINETSHNTIIIHAYTDDYKKMYTDMRTDDLVKIAYVKFKVKQTDIKVANIELEEHNYWNGVGNRSRYETSQYKIVNIDKNGNDISANNPYYHECTSKTITNVVFSSKSNNNFLSTLSVDKAELEPAFNKNKINYEVYVPFDVEKINVTATPEDGKASLSGNGEKKLEVGDNKINLVVTAEDGSKKTYTVNIIRKAANDDTSLSKVLVRDSNKAKINLTYDERSKTYKGNVSSEITFVSFDIKCSGEECFVDELEPEALADGANVFKFTVASQKGDKEEYRIIINKEATRKDNSILYLSIGLAALALLCIVLLILYLKNRNR